MKAKKISIDTTNPKTKKCYNFIFNVNNEMKRDKIVDNIKKVMAEINPNFSFYISPKDWDVDSVSSFEEIKKHFFREFYPEKEDGYK